MIIYISGMRMGGSDPGHRSLAAGTGAFTLTGQAADLEYAGLEPIQPVWLRPAICGPLTNTHQLVLTCTAISGITYSLVLPSPNFDNKEKLQYTRVNRRTRGGDLIVYRDSYWPKSTVFSLPFNYLDDKTIDSVLLFMRNTLGQITTLVDHENRTFTGIIISPESDIKENAKRLSTITIDFETVS